jgi:lipoic acid synthetase
LSYWKIRGSLWLRKGEREKVGAAKPPWLRVRLSLSENFTFVRKLVLDLGLHTVCEQANCPNAVECWNARTATFLILGDRCSRNCNFCAVTPGPRGLPDPDEPEKISRAVRLMELSFVVLTSVTRDDLEDGGAEHFVRTLASIRCRNPQPLVEVLAPDFNGSEKAIKMLVQERPDVLGHNVETVPRLYPQVRPGADYQRSLALFNHAHEVDPSIPLKSGLMLGLGESSDEVMGVMKDLIEAGCRLLTLGQYLQPSRAHLAVDRFVTPDEFDEWREIALGLGFAGVASGPLVRSSYRARDLYLEAREQSASQDGFGMRPEEALS